MQVACVTGVKRRGEEREKRSPLFLFSLPFPPTPPPPPPQFNACHPGYMHELFISYTGHMCLVDGIRRCYARKCFVILVLQFANRHKNERTVFVISGLHVIATLVT